MDSKDLESKYNLDRLNNLNINNTIQVLNYIYPDRIKYEPHLRILQRITSCTKEELLSVISLDNLDREHLWFIQDNPNFEPYMLKSVKNINNLNWERLSKHPKITFEFILENPEFKWKKKYVSENPNVTWDNVVNNPEYDWDLYGLSKNRNITIDIINQNFHYFENREQRIDNRYRMNSWCFNKFSRNPNTTWEIITEYPEYDWDLSEFSKNKNLTVDVVIKKGIIQNKLDWDSIIENLELIYKLFEELSDNHKQIAIQRIDWNMLSYDDNLSFMFIKKNLNLPWNWKNISHNENFDFSILQYLPNDILNKLSWKTLSSNQKLEFDFVKNNLQYPWKWYELSSNVNITPDIVKNNRSYDWHYFCFAKNPNFTLKTYLHVINLLMNKYKDEDATKDYFEYLQENAFDDNEIVKNRKLRDKDRNLCLRYLTRILKTEDRIYDDLIFQINNY
jgi:hypothetical protein